MAAQYPITLIWPADAQIATIGGRWRRLADGRIEAIYGTPDELALCLAAVGRDPARFAKYFVGTTEAGLGRTTNPGPDELSDDGRDVEARDHAGGGWVEWRMVSGCGPYAYLRWWEGGRKRMKYLGKRGAFGGQGGPGKSETPTKPMTEKAGQTLPTKSGEPGSDAHQTG